MPSLASHLAGARIVADRLGHPAIEAGRGAFYLGATAPDLRSIARIPREQTHFYLLDDFGAQDPVARLLEAHPRLAAVDDLDAETRALMAGYITHLLMDQRYIEQVYRAYFGVASKLGGDARADLLDRLLQYELDRREREGEALAAVHAAMQDTSGAVDLGFVEREQLARWRDVAIQMASHPPSWDRWARTAQRHVPGETTEDTDSLLRDVPDLLREVLDHVTEDRLRAFMDESIEEATARVKAYLG